MRLYVYEDFLHWNINVVRPGLPRSPWHLQEESRHAQAPSPPFPVHAMPEPELSVEEPTDLFQCGFFFPLTTVSNIQSFPTLGECLLT